MSSSQTSTDRIEQQVRLSTPQARVWRALTDIREFGQWFGVKLSGAVTPGAKLRGPITSPGYEHITFEATVETDEPEKRFSFRWHPYAIEPGVDYSNEPTTLVGFHAGRGRGWNAAHGCRNGLRQDPSIAPSQGVRDELEGVGDPDGEHQAASRRLS